MNSLNTKTISILALLVFTSTSVLADRRHSSDQHKSHSHKPDRHHTYSHNYKHHDHKARLVSSARHHYQHDQRWHANKGWHKKHHGYSSHHYHPKHHNKHHVKHYYQPRYSYNYRPIKRIHNALRSHYYPHHGLNIALRFSCKYLVFPLCEKLSRTKKADNVRLLFILKIRHQTIAYNND